MSLDIPENDPRLKAAQEAIDKERARRPHRAAEPDQPGPVFRYVHVPDAPPGREVTIEEVNPPQRQPLTGEQCIGAAIVLLFALWVGWPAWSILINIISALWEAAS